MRRVGYRRDDARDARQRRESRPEQSGREAGPRPAPGNGRGRSGTEAALEGWQQKLAQNSCDRRSHRRGAFRRTPRASSTNAEAEWRKMSSNRCVRARSGDDGAFRRASGICAERDWRARTGGVGAPRNRRARHRSAARSRGIVRAAGKRARRGGARGDRKSARRVGRAAGPVDTGARGRADARRFEEACRRAAERHQNRQEIGQRHTRASRAVRRSRAPVVGTGSRAGRGTPCVRNGRRSTRKSKVSIPATAERFAAAEARVQDARRGAASGSRAGASAAGAARRAADRARGDARRRRRSHASRSGSARARSARRRSKRR